MSHVLAVDPGIRYPAAALFVDGVLVSASRVKLKTAWAKLPVAERVLTVAREIRTWYGGKITVNPTKVDYVFEWPQVYTRLKSKGDPNDLMPLAGVGMCLAGLLYDQIHELGMHSYKPRDWAGNTPKATTGDPLASVRGQRIWARLSEAERATVTLSHDCLDAIGIGLKFLGRFERVVNFIGATRDA